MKTVFQFFVVAILSFGALSCTKSSSTNNVVMPPPSSNDPFIYSRISRNIVQPVSMQLGTASSTLHLDDVVTIFVPYDSRNEEFTSTAITMADEATNLPINTYDMISSEDPSAADLNLPEEIMFGQHKFFFVTFHIDESYIGKSVSITSRLEGQITSSTDVINGAFNVVP